MPRRLICCVSLPPATILSVPIYDFAIAHQELLDEETEQYFPCCGKSLCGGCIYSYRKSANIGKCPFCNADRDKTDEEIVAELRKRVEANDPASMYVLANYYDYGCNGLQQDYARAIELYARSANLGFSKAHNNLAGVYHEGGNLKKAKFHFEAAAMAGHEVARFNIGTMEAKSGNTERAIKHWKIAAPAGCYQSMHALMTLFEEGAISRESIDSTLTAYNNSCAEMRSEARDAYIQNKAEAL
jgi:tetratricopeptide (TPR) repeat protein